MADAGALPPLVACLHSPEEGVSWTSAAGACGARGGALLALRTMAADDDIASQLLHLEGAVDGAMQLVAHAEPEVTLGALALLCMLAAHTHDHGCFVQAWAFPQVLPCLEHADADCRYDASAVNDTPFQTTRLTALQVDTVVLCSLCLSAAVLWWLLTGGHGHHCHVCLCFGAARVLCLAVFLPIG